MSRGCVSLSGMLLDAHLKSERSSQKVLILGERVTAQVIAEQLTELGFEPVLQSTIAPGLLPHWVDPDKVDRLRELFAKFQSLSPDARLIHPGTGAWAERAELSSVAQQLGLAVIAPSVKVLSVFSNKLGFLLEAGQIGIPHLVHSLDPMHSVREIELFIEKSRQTFPFVLRSIKGSGRLGSFLVPDSTSLGSSLRLWCDQIRRCYGEVILFVEKYLEGARKVVVPFVRFQDGRIHIFPISDASLQSHSRKLLEFCPTWRITPALKKQIVEWTTRLASHLGYVGVGAFEYLVDSSRAFLFDGIPRLNTGFHLWEQVADTRAVEWQLAALQNRDTIPEFSSKSEKNWGLSVRIYAEDSLFHLPCPGPIHEISPLREWKSETAVGNRGVRAQLYSNYESGESVSIVDSGLVGVLFILSQSRKQLLPIAQKVLHELWISGILQTNERFLIELLDHPWVKEGIFHTEFIDEEFIPVIRPSIETIRLAVALCGFCQISEKRDLSRRWYAGEQVSSLDPAAIESLHWLEGPDFFFKDRIGISGRVEMEGGISVRICAFPFPDSERWLVRLGSWFINVRPIFQTAPGATRPRPRLSALVAGRVHAILFREGVRVKAHDTLLIVESMGIFVPHALPVDAKVVSWRIRAEDRVTAGQEIADIEILN